MTKSRNIYAKRRRFSEGELDLVRRYYADVPTAGLATLLQRTPSSVYQVAYKLKLQKSDAFFAGMQSGRINGHTAASIACRFPKGHVPYNKGMLGRPSTGRMAETQFKKGQKPHGWKPVGSFRYSKEGYLQKKISDTGMTRRDFRPVHHLVWQEKHGAIPAGHVVVFRDRNKANIVIDNLECISFAENMRRNTIHRYGPEIKSAMRSVGKLKRTISRIESEKQNSRSA